MDDTKKLLKKIFTISTLIFFIVGAFILLAPNKKRLEAQASVSDSLIEVEAPGSAPKDNALTESHMMLSQEKSTYCQSLKSQLPSIEEWKKTEQLSERFVNVHKRVNGTVYRLRFFYKDHAEGDTPTYLLYVEDSGDVAHLLEKSSHKKGKEYARIENEAGEILYTEKGIAAGREESLFLHYVNSKLKGLQGTLPELNSKAFIDCRY